LAFSSSAAGWTRASPGIRLELVQVIDQVQGPQRARLVGCAELGDQHLAVVVAMDVPGHAKADRALGHVGQALDHARI
jgi:hypothetical protein